MRLLGAANGEAPARARCRRASKPTSPPSRRLARGAPRGAARTSEPTRADREASATADAARQRAGRACSRRRARAGDADARRSRRPSPLDDVPTGTRRRRRESRALSDDPRRQARRRSTRSRSVVAECTRCPLYATATNPVPGEGNPDADFMCVGEAPGANEDEQGVPFVGAGGPAAHEDPRGDRPDARGRLHRATSSSTGRRGTAIRCRKR